VPNRRSGLILSACLLLPFAASAAPDGSAATGKTDDVAPACPVGVLVCPKPKVNYAACKRNDLFDFYTPGLPGAGDRSAAPTNLVARKVIQADKTHDRLEGDVELSKLDALLKADVLTYDRETTDYTATGNVRYQDHASLLAADSAHGTGTPNTTYLDNVRYQLLDQRGNGVAAKANQTDPDHQQAFDATYPQSSALGTNLGTNAVYRSTWAAGVATSSTINEAVIVNDAGTNATSTSANTYARTVLTTVNKGASDSLVITWNWKYLAP